MSLGGVLACKDEGQGLKLEEKEKWYSDEVERPKVMIEAKVETRTRLIEVEFKQGRKLRCRDYLSKQRMRRQFRGGLLIVS